MKKIVLFLLSSAFLLSAVLPTHAVLPKEFYEEYNLGAEYYLAGGVYYSSFQNFSEFEEYVDGNARVCKDESITLDAVKEKGVYLPEAFRNDGTALVRIDVGSQSVLEMTYKKDGNYFVYHINYGYTYDEKKYDVARTSGGTTVYSGKKEVKSDLPYDENHYYMNTGSSSVSLSVYGNDGDYLEYCDMYEYSLNLSDLAAGEGVTVRKRRVFGELS